MEFVICYFLTKQKNTHKNIASIHALIEQHFRTCCLALVNCKCSFQDDLEMDDLATVRVLLEEQAQILAQLEKEKPNLQSDLVQGRRMLRDENAPDFLQETVGDLEDRLTEAEKMARLKMARLQEGAENWESYESNKSQLQDFLRRAEIEAGRKPSPGGQETIQKEMATKQEMMVAIQDLEPEVEKITALGKTLQQTASQAGQDNLKQEVVSIQERMEALTRRLTERVTELQQADAKWTEFYTQLNMFSDWLGEKQQELKEIHESEATPDQQFDQAKVGDN